MARQVLPTDQPPEGARSADAKPKLTFVPLRRGKAPKHLADLTLSERKTWASELGSKAFRADQLSRHYFGHYLADCTAMTDIARADRELLQTMVPPLVNEVTTQFADRGLTVKTLWSLFDGARVESVLMRYRERTTLCVSSQAGCGMGCPFCATGQLGLTRNLSTGEIVDQVREAALRCASGGIGETPTRLSNIVFMGMGEPLANYRAIMAAIRRFVNPVPEGFGISARAITVSTVGLVPAIGKLAQEGLPLRLAVSLHAPDDALRDDLIPINSRWKVDQLLDAAYNYFEITSRRVSIEYALIRDMNDHQWRAKLLADKLNERGRGWAHVNPIPLNPTPGSIWTASSAQAQARFVDTLRAEGITTTIRDTRGSDIDGACGQLASATANAEKKGAR